MSVCVFAGTFDPITKGHVAIIKKLLKQYKKVIVVVGENSKKAPLFSAEQRVNSIKACFYGNKKIQVINYADKKDCYVQFLQEQNAKFYARGIRNDVDLEYEKKAELVNKELYPWLKTIYLKAKGFYKEVSSSLVREKMLSGKDYKKYLPKKAYNLIKGYLKEKF